MRPRVLFVVNEVAHFSEFKKILRNPEASQIDPIILFDRDGYDLNSLFQNEIADCKTSGIAFRLLSFPQGDLPSKSKRLLQTISYYVNKLFLFKRLNYFIQIILQIEEYRNFFKAKIKLLQHFYKNENIQSLVLGEENVLMDTFVYKTAANHQKVIIYPYTIPNPKEMSGGAALSMNAKSAKALWMRLVGGRFAKVFDDRLYLLLRPAKIFALKTLGYSPRNPWVLNDDLADLICIESKSMADIYLKLGVSSRKISTIGSFNDDLLLAFIQDKKRLKEQLQLRHGLTSEKPIVLVAFPPDQFPRSAAEKASYEDLITTFKNVLSEHLIHYSIVITKHPRTQNSFKQLRDAGFVISDDPTLNLIPLAYIYVASVSATIRWAIAAGVPVVNYDIYRYHYDDYRTANAVKTVDSETDFKRELNRLLTEPSYHATQSKIQLSEAPYWGVMDGKVAHRFFKLISSSKA
jgi:hypothetical protein